jgi:peroxin-19
MDLDSILDQALDDFEEQQLNEKVHEQSVGSGDDGLDLEAQRQRDHMNKMLDSLQDPEYGEVLQSTLQSLSGTTEGIQSVDNLFDDLAKQFQTNLKSNLYPDGPNDDIGISLGDREVGSTMKMIATAQKGMEGFEPAKLEEVGEGMMEDMMAQFEALGEKEDYNEVIDGVMRQLLSKDLMYEPTKQICEKFPEWLALHRYDFEVPDNITCADFLLPFPS